MLLIISFNVESLDFNAVMHCIRDERCLLLLQHGGFSEFLVCLAKMNLEIGPSFLDSWFRIPIKNPFSKYSSLVQDNICHVDYLWLAVWALCCISIMYEFVNGHEDAINWVNRVIYHLMYCFFLCLKFLWSDAAISIVKVLGDICDIETDAACCRIAKCFEILQFNCCDQLLSQGMFNTLDFPEDSESLLVLVSHAALLYNVFSSGDRTRSKCPCAPPPRSE